MAKSQLKPKVYTDSPKTDKEGNPIGGDYVAPLQVRYYGNEKEKSEAKASIMEYFTCLFNGTKPFDKIIKYFCIYDSSNTWA